MPSGTQTIAGVERALDVLSLFAETEASDLGVTEIAEQLDLSKAVVHRILSSFRVKGFIELDETTRRYRIGPRTLTVGLSYLNRIDQLDIARASLLELADRTGETATQSVRAGSSAVYVGQVPSSRQVRVVVQLGAAYPLHVGAASKVLLAWVGPRDLDAYIASIARDLNGGESALRRTLAQVRESGYAESWSEREPDVGSVAAPVRDHVGRVVAALAVSGPTERLVADVEDHVKVVLDVADEVSQTLGSH